LTRLPNKTQKLILLITIFNLLIVLFFPPFDDLAVTSHGAAIFAGFLFVFSAAKGMTVNSGLLYLELMVVFVNLGILWMLTEQDSRRKADKKFNFRKAAMVLIMLNLLGVLLFPPFEYISNMTNATIPTFEGFYFIFSHPPFRVIVTPILYLEVIFILINGGLMMLAFKQRPEAVSAEDAVIYAAMLKAQQRKKG